MEWIGKDINEIKNKSYTGFKLIF